MRRWGTAALLGVRPALAVLRPAARGLLVAPRWALPWRQPVQRPLLRECLPGAQHVLTVMGEAGTEGLPRRSRPQGHRAHHGAARQGVACGQRGLGLCCSLSSFPRVSARERGAPAGCRRAGGAGRGERRVGRWEVRAQACVGRTCAKKTGRAGAEAGAQGRGHAGKGEPQHARPGVWTPGRMALGPLP